MNIKTYSYFLLIGFSLTPTYGMFGRLFGTGKKKNNNKAFDLYQLVVKPQKGDYTSFPHAYIAALHEENKRLAKENKELKKQLKQPNNNPIAINKNIDDNKDDEKKDENDDNFQVNESLLTPYKEPTYPILEFTTNKKPLNINTKYQPLLNYKEIANNQSVTQAYHENATKGLAISSDQTIWLCRGNTLFSMTSQKKRSGFGNLPSDTKRIIPYENGSFILLRKQYLSICNLKIGPICETLIKKINDQKEFGLMHYKQGHSIVETFLIKILSWGL